MQHRLTQMVSGYFRIFARGILFGNAAYTEKPGFFNPPRQFRSPKSLKHP
jgi:hypothetical protein